MEELQETLLQLCEPESTINTGGEQVKNQYARVRFGGNNLCLTSSISFLSITLDAVARALPSCSREGSTSFLRGRLTILGSYKLSQVQLLVDLHAIGCQGVVPSIETERYASRLVTPDILRGLAMSISSLQRFLAPLMSLEPGRDVAIRHSDHTSGEVPQPSLFMDSRQLDDNRKDGPEVGAS
ncbi:hypothetical protein EDD17DRAFT_55815 [Pisolithus thermaeus]|nr:hypothetical protein EDD17DRAFT_55815 [Pisolithus thermaeus]